MQFLGYRPMAVLSGSMTQAYTVDALFFVNTNANEDFNPMPYESVTEKPLSFEIPKAGKLLQKLPTIKGLAMRSDVFSQ